jgi:ABC-2 type transport system ATP-binding protein
MRLAVGLMKPAAGEILLMGQPPWNNPDLLSRIGYAPEHDGFYEFQTGFQFVRSMLQMRGHHGKDAKDRAHKAIERVGLSKEADRRINTYSRGMRQRIKIAQAIAHDPDILILDEPLAGADPIVRQQLVDLIRSFPAGGKHVLVSSHILHEVEQLTSRVILIHRGRLIADGDVPQIRELIDRHPHSVRVRTSKPRELGAALAAEPILTEVSFPEKDLLSLRTRTPDKLYARLPEIALQVNCDIREIHSPEENLEAVLRYLTER